jgi:hypothetical protein
MGAAATGFNPVGGVETISSATTTALPAGARNLLDIREVHVLACGCRTIHPCCFLSNTLTKNHRSIPACSFGHSDFGQRPPIIIGHVGYQAFFC